MIFEKLSDLDFIHPSRGAKFSPNLHAFLAGKKNLSPHHDWQGALMVGPLGPESPPILHVGWVFDHELQGARLSTVLRDGKRSTVWCYTQPYVIVEDFWADYEKKGRCIADVEHRGSFIGDKSRFAEDGDRRVCTWCGVVQQVERWTETVVKERERWVTVPSIRVPTGATP